MRSFSIIRTLPSLTTNVKLIVTSTYDLYLESFNSHPQLSTDKYKHFLVNKDNFWDEILPQYYINTPASIAFTTKYDNDNDKMSNDFSNQYDDIYQMGCKEVEDTYYSEEFEAFAPLYINPSKIPSNFIIFRVDNPGIINLTKDNFTTEILNNLKVVSLFDLSPATSLGSFIDKNFTSNTYFPITPFEFDVRTTEFSNWNGIDYETGGYTSKSLFMNDVLLSENTFFDFDNFITSGYENNKLIFPNILNLKFLFNDVPATSKSLRPWSINRYFGFYLDSLYQEMSVTPYSPPLLKKNIIIVTDNIIVDNEFYENIDPTVKGWDITATYYVEYNGNFYHLIRYPNPVQPVNPNIILNSAGNEINSAAIDYIYKIISDIDLSGQQNFLNQNIISIDSSNNISCNTLYNSTGTFSIPNFTDASVHIININNVYHVININQNGQYYLNTDYGFRINNNKLEYFVNDPDPAYNTTFDMTQISYDIKPITCAIYKIEFTNIKDFDTTIVNTKQGNYEYEQDAQLTLTNEPKFFVSDISKNQNPNPLENFVYQSNQVNIPATSEYVTTGEIFRIDNNDLSSIWRKNAVSSKWGFQNSLSANDYPYHINNAMIGDDFNRTTNTILNQPARHERNLDYFYTINPDSNIYTNHSLHVSDYDQFLNINTTFSFDLPKYFNSTFSSTTYSNDYFAYFFSKKDYFNYGELIKNNSKWSEFNAGDNIFPNSTLFRGIKFNLQDVKNVNVDAIGVLQTITPENNNTYEDWKFSILLNSNDYDINNNFGATYSSLQWSIINTWTLDSQFNQYDISLFNDILYIANTASLINHPLFNPANSSDWGILPYTVTFSTIFWNPGYSYSTTNGGNVVYNGGEFYNSISTTASYANFWNPGATYSSMSSYVIYKNNTYVYATSSAQMGILPINTNYWNPTVLDITNAPTFSQWKQIGLWNPLSTYNKNDYSIQNNIIYQSAANANIFNTPGTNNTWNYFYSLVPSSTYLYGLSFSQNNIINLNNKYYLNVGNTQSNTLNSGIVIYVNKKWQNVLVNININDNTVPNLNNVNRDILYTDLNSKLTAKNFMDAINDMENDYGFANPITYYVINEDNTFNSYNINNIQDLPVILTTELADSLSVRLDSYIVTPNTPNKNLITAVNSLDSNNTIISINDINYYDNGPLGRTFTKNKNDINIVDNYSGLKNYHYAVLYRYNGFYSPIFYDIELFTKPTLTDDLLPGNWLFDTELTNFGIIKERIFSKVNRKNNILKLANVNNQTSIYPMLDEFGYSFSDFFMFKSTWDLGYYTEINKII